MNTKMDVLNLIEESKIGNKQEFLESILPSIRLIATPTDLDSEDLGTSRMGGLPDLPSHMEWPSWSVPDSKRDRFEMLDIEASSKRLLNFIAQINLADIAPFEAAKDLPQTGLLYFFYDIEACTWGFDPLDAGSARVIYFDGQFSELRRANPDTELSYALTPAKLAFEEIWTINDTLERGHSKDEEFEECQSLIEKINDIDPFHHLFGNPQTIQDAMEVECQLVTNGIYLGSGDGYRSPEAELLLPGAADWLLLLQVDTDEDNLDCMWGDCGRIYFWIRKQDLKERRFDRAWLILQCY